jgi:N-methylhydantoinase A
VLVPREASIFCAAGMLHTDFKHDFVRSVTCALVAGGDDVKRLRDVIEEMEALAQETLEAETVPRAERQFQYSADLRYRGQFNEISVELARESLMNWDLTDILAKFHARHDQLYGYSLADQPTVVEMISVRVRGIGLTPKPATVIEPDHGPACGRARKGRRPIWLPNREAFHDVDVYDGDALTHGNRVTGPAIVESVNTTIVVPSDCTLAVNAVGTCVIEFQR